MSSLKDIMDVDVDPLESQAYRRSQAASREKKELEQATRSLDDPSSHSPSPQPNNISGTTTTITRRRSNRVSKPSSTPIASRPSSSRRRSSAAGDPMDFTSSSYQGVGGGSSSQGPSRTSGSPQQASSRGSEATTDVPVKYTPVTGRISRAKKGVPVHTCEICKPVKTFTRAEHLRRHQLSHQKPAYPCTFEDCERSFHRPDLLARHMSRHETQGEKAYKAGSRSRGSSIASENVLQPPKGPDAASQDTPAGQPQTSPTETMTPRTSASGDNSMTVTGNFQAVNFAPSSSSKRSASEAQLPESYVPFTSSYSPFKKNKTGSPGESYSRPIGNYEQTFAVQQPRTSMPDQETYPSSSQANFDGLYSGGVDPQFPNYSGQHNSLPLLRIPEEPFMPGLSFTQDNSPWCSSASDSTYSTPSDRNGRHFPTRRQRSVSVTANDWAAPVAATQWSPHLLSSNTPQEMRAPALDGFMEHFDAQYTSPHMSPPPTSRQLLDVPNNSFVGYYNNMESAAVGSPPTSTYNKPMAQTFPASSSRVPPAGLASNDRRSQEELLGGQTATIGSSKAGSPQQASRLDAYISSYWKFFDQLYPIVHRKFVRNTSKLLTLALAAIGTQYYNNSEARKDGIAYNAECRKMIDLCPAWTLETMQAILLTETFTRFRGKKINVRLSRPFEELCSRLMSPPGQASELYTGQDLEMNNTAATRARFNSQDLRNSDLQTEWSRWVEKESRRRLLSACFLFDVRQAKYHEQSQSRASRSTNVFSLLYVPCPRILWNQMTASDWQSTLQADYDIEPLQLVDQALSLQPPQFVLDRDYFTQSLLISTLAARLPSTIPTLALFETPLAHAYLALHYTPLRDLLAVAGDTWIFSQKMKPPSAFKDAQSRLRTWSSSLNAAMATKHACRVLLATLSVPALGPLSPDESLSPEFFDLSNYWILYTSALICWGFGTRYSTPNSASGPTTTWDESSTRLTDIDQQILRSSQDAQNKAVAYLNAMQDLSYDDLLTPRASMRGETSSVIETVLARLEICGVGDRCGWLVDAISVLKKIKGGRRKGNGF